MSISNFLLWGVIKEVSISMNSHQISFQVMWSLNKVSLRNQSLFEVSLSINSHQISFQAMWSYSKPILLLHYCRKSENIRDFIKKYFHLNTIAVYNSSAKNLLNINEMKYSWQTGRSCPREGERVPGAHLDFSPVYSQSVQFFFFSV